MALSSQLLRASYMLDGFFPKMGISPNPFSTNLGGRSWIGIRSRLLPNSEGRTTLEELFIPRYRLLSFVCLALEVATPIMDLNGREIVIGWVWLFSLLSCSLT
jgi:hypothetical protein